jgi:hypothetical protein
VPGWRDHRRGCRGLKTIAGGRLFRRRLACAALDDVPDLGIELWPPLVKHALEDWFLQTVRAKVRIQGP